MNEFDQIINDGSAQGIINELPEQVE